MAPLPETRNSLLLQVRNPRDAAAWEQFVAIYRPAVYRLARREGLQDADAEDLAQGVLLSVSKAIGEWEKDEKRGTFRAWLLRVARNAIIMVGNGVDRVTLTDFGLARAADDASLTKSGLIAGTPHYMSPEQSRGEAVDPRSDLFSLGSVLYTMCTGHPPFRAESSYGILRRITDVEPRPIREVNPEIPQWLCGVIAKLLAKQPGARFANAQEVAKLLADCLAHVQQPNSAALPQQARDLETQVSVPQGIGKLAKSKIVAALVALGLTLAALQFSLMGSGSIDSDDAKKNERHSKGEPVRRDQKRIPNQNIHEIRANLALAEYVVLKPSRENGGGSFRISDDATLRSMGRSIPKGTKVANADGKIATASYVVVEVFGDPKAKVPEMRITIAPTIGLYHVDGVLYEFRTPDFSLYQKVLALTQPTNGKAGSQTDEPPGQPASFDKSDAMESTSWRNRVNVMPRIGKLVVGKLAKVSVAPALYERKDDKQFFIRVSVHNQTNREIAVDLRDPRFVISLNQWGVFDRPERGIIDERRMEAVEFTVDDRKRLNAAFARKRDLVHVPSGKSVDYYWPFNGPIDKSTRTAVDGAGGQFVILSMAGELRVTDGKQCEILRCGEPGEADVAIPRPIPWGEAPARVINNP